MTKIVRPWGKMWVLYSNPKFWLKFIHVRTRTSLQYHVARTEYHISLKGIKKICPFEHHRITKGNYIELAFGNPDEEDIHRIEDDYGRV